MGLLRLSHVALCHGVQGVTAMYILSIYLDLFGFI
jgi:hypothetical protein